MPHRDPEAQREYMRKYQKENKEARRAYDRKWRAANRKAHREYMRKWHAENPEYQRKYREENREAWLLSAARSRAKKHNRECTITVADIIIPTHCPVLGIELKRGEGKLHAASPSIDRIDSALGYVPGNVHVISHRANVLKRDRPLEAVMAEYADQRARALNGT